MSTYGIQATKEKNVFTSPKVDKIIDPDFSFLKTFKQGSATVNVTQNGTFTVDVTHGLGYYPIFLVYNTFDPDSPEWRFPGRFVAQGVGIEIGADHYITKEILHMAWEDTSAPPGSFRAYPYTITFYYYIFYDPLE